MSRRPAPSGEEPELHGDDTLGYPAVKAESVTPHATVDARSATLLFLALGLVSVLLSYGDTWSTMVEVWAGSETFNHGFAIAPIAAWLVWRNRDALAACSPEPSWFGVLLTAGCCALWLVARASGVNVVAAFAVVAMLPSIVIASAGGKLSWVIAFPLMFLFFMVPAGDGLTPMLMEATAEATVWAVAASGIPVYREGLHFTLPTGRWSVVEACSGLRYVIAAAVLSTLFAHLNFRSLRAKAVFVAVGIAVALVANWMRAYLIVMIGHLSGMRLGVGEDHVWYGWIFFGLTMFVVFWLGARWRDVSPAGGVVVHEGDGRSSGAAAHRVALPLARATMIAGTALALIVSTPWVLDTLIDVEPRPSAKERLTVALLGGAEQPPVLVPRFTGARSVVQGSFGQGLEADLYVAYFAGQRPGHEMISFDNTILGSGDNRWQLVARSIASVDAGGIGMSVEERIVRSATGRRLVWSWYTVGGREATDARAAKALTALSILAGRGDHSTVAVLGTPVAGSTEGPPDQTKLEEARARLLRAVPAVVEATRSVTGP
jgi:exosortase A